MYYVYIPWAHSFLACPGKGIGPYDILITGQAKARNMILITHNAKEFSRVKGLENRGLGSMQRDIMKFAVILSGCGQYDGSETQETVLTFLSLAQEKIEWESFAPDIELEVVNHLTGERDGREKRSVLKESARLARGRIKPLIDLDVQRYQAIIFPGGMGAVKNWCDWLDRGPQFEFQAEIQWVIDQAVALKKPMGFICIAPMMITKIYPKATFTIGHDARLADEIKKAGGYHQSCEASEVAIDSIYRVVSTPANMVARSIDEVYHGILKLVEALKQMVMEV